MCKLREKCETRESEELQVSKVRKPPHPEPKIENQKILKVLKPCFISGGADFHNPNHKLEIMKETYFSLRYIDFYFN